MEGAGLGWAKPSQQARPATGCRHSVKCGPPGALKPVLTLEAAVAAGGLPPVRTVPHHRRPAHDEEVGQRDLRRELPGLQPDRVLVPGAPGPAALVEAHGVGQRRRDLFRIRRTQRLLRHVVATGPDPSQLGVASNTSLKPQGG